MTSAALIPASVAVLPTASTALVPGNASSFAAISDFRVLVFIRKSLGDERTESGMLLGRTAAVCWPRAPAVVPAVFSVTVPVTAVCALVRRRGWCRRLPPRTDTITEINTRTPGRYYLIYLQHGVSLNRVHTRGVGVDGLWELPYNC